ncbi:MAG: hypothetical protein ACI4IQ_03540, partial [Eubacterium sp.]
HKNIKSVVMDVSALFEEDEDTSYRKNLSNMKWSLNKLKAIYDYCKYVDTAEKEENGVSNFFISYIFEILQYHSRWNELKEEDFNYKSEDYEFYLGTYIGSEMRTPDIPYEKFIVDNDTEADNDKKLNEVQAGYFQKIIDLCKEKDLELVIIKTPKQSWTKAGHDYVQRVADENNIPFFDFTTDGYFKAAQLNYYTDFNDKDHLNIRGADKLTDYLVDYLISKDEYTDYRKTDVFDQKMLDIYHEDYNNKYLKTSKSIDDFLKYMNYPNYSVVIHSSADISSAWNDEYQKYLSDIGIKTDIADTSGLNYVIIVDQGKVTYEEVSKAPIKYEGKLPDGKKLEAVGDISLGETQSCITLNDKDYSYPKNGLNITVYNNDTNSVVKKSTIALSGNSLILS